MTRKQLYLTALVLALVCALVGLVTWHAPGDRKAAPRLPVDLGADKVSPASAIGGEAASPDVGRGRVAGALWITVDFGRFRPPRRGLQVRVASLTSGWARELVVDGTLRVDGAPEGPLEVRVDDPGWRSAPQRVGTSVPAETAETVVRLPAIPRRYLTACLVSARDGRALPAARLTIRTTDSAQRSAFEPLPTHVPTSDGCLALGLSDPGDAVELELRAEGFAALRLGPVPLPLEGELALGTLALEPLRRLRVRLVVLGRGTAVRESGLAVVAPESELGDLPLDLTAAGPAAWRLPRSLAREADVRALSADEYEVLPRVEGALRIAAFGEGLAPALSPVVEPGLEDEPSVDLVLAPGALLQGTLLASADPESAPRVEHVELTGPDLSRTVQLPAAQRLDRQEFRASGLPAGRYTATAWGVPAGGASDAASVPLGGAAFEVLDTRDVQLVIDLGAGLSGTRLAGSILLGAEVDPGTVVVGLYERDGRGAPLQTSPAAGERFGFTGVEPGDYLLVFGGVSADRSVLVVGTRPVQVSGGGPVEVALRPLGTRVEGELLGGDGARVPRADLVVLPGPNTGLAEGLAHELRLRTNGAGRFTLEGLPPGEYTLQRRGGALVGRLSLAGPGTVSLLCRGDP